MGNRELGWRSPYEKGKFHLSHHKPECALRCFESALAACPVSRSRELSKVLFYLGITFKKMGMSSCAVKSWNASYVLDKNSYAGRLLQRHTNEYGMVKQETRELDDWRAFYAIHLSRYLSRKKSGKLGTDAEKDMIWDLILDAWKQIRETLQSTDMSVEMKIGIFKQARIVFPFIQVPDMRSHDHMIAVDFAQKKRIAFDDPCFCGSGLLYIMCCGLIVDQRERPNGVI